MNEATAQPVEEVEGDMPGRERDLSKIGVHHSSLERSVRHRVEAELRARILDLGVVVPNPGRVMYGG